MPKTKQVKITLTTDDAERLEKLSDNTGLAKSTLVKLMLSGTLRDIQEKPYESGSGSLILAWCSKRAKDVVKGIHIW